MKVRETKNEHFLTAFASAIGSKVEGGRVNIPGKYGKGYVFGYLLDHRIRLIIRNYEFKEDVEIKRSDYSSATNMIAITFQNIIKESENSNHQNIGPRQLPSVVIATQGLDSDVYIPGNISFNTLKLNVDASYVRQLLGPDIDNALLKNIIENKQPLLFEQFVSLKLEQIFAELIATRVEKSLHQFFYQVKSEEIVCYLLMELTQRQERTTIQSINSEDAKNIYAARERLLKDLANPPTQDELAAFANMSLSKLKRLFKQVYGQNVFQYFQAVRMKEAAYFLKHKGMSVSEVGYALGFSNLSHFTRVFEAHTGIKPKKYSKI
ncbi:AraC family transcriptional regulator [Chryseolinea sp. T2]|uniref:helix-turn-helix domain-containing protein n=1 Tax=Chryseolinea sp. T2 TaxID=3129255 RepID=UPI003077B513